MKRIILILVFLIIGCEQIPVPSDHGYEPIPPNKLKERNIMIGKINAKLRTQDKDTICEIKIYEHDFRGTGAVTFTLEDLRSIYVDFTISKSHQMYLFRKKACDAVEKIEPPTKN